jgi:hypothetical protein
MRRVEGFPLRMLWDSTGCEHDTRRIVDLLRDQADLLIVRRKADIVIAQVGAPLFWLRRDTIHRFWRATSKGGYYFTITQYGQLIDKTSAPAYIFYPSEWEPISDFPLVLLELVCWPYDSNLKMF